MSRLNSRLTIGVCSVLAIIAIVKNSHSDLRISQQGMELIGNAEGCRRDPYHCPADILTVGIGSTATSGEKIIKHKGYTDKEIAERFTTDLKIAENCVNQHANGKNMPQGAFDSLVSITFNVGCTKMKTSTLFKMAKKGYTSEMCYQLNRWVYSGGKRLRGLAIRREKETALCLSVDSAVAQ